MNTTRKTPHSNVLYMEADVNYTIFHLSDGRRLVSAFTLKKFEEKKEHEAFLRVSKSYLLNPDYIKNYNKDGKKGTIELVNGKIIAVSRRKMGLLKVLQNN